MDNCDVKSNKVKKCKNILDIIKPRGVEKLKEIVKNALNSPEPEQQINLLKQALNVFYDNPNDDYGGYLSEMYPRGYAISLFNTNYDENLAAPSPISSTFEERAAASRKIR